MITTIRSQLLSLRQIVVLLFFFFLPKYQQCLDERAAVLCVCPNSLVFYEGPRDYENNYL